MVDSFFEYIKFPEDRNVKFFAYRLKGSASVWWDRLREMRMRDLHGPVQTWSRMKQLLRCRFFCLWTKNNIFFMLIRYVHMVPGG